MNDSQLFSSFMMLGEHLYETFVQYILNGRTRSPPETELIEMLPTFQFGAKTDRRALQSKFKSWAKRMKFENGRLVLNTGKIIIPREMCDKLVMSMHSTEHFNVEYVVSQIQKHYTWTKKNFGMDRYMVVESIMRNCKREECIKMIRLGAAKIGNSFCSGMLKISVPEMTFGMSPPLPYFTAYRYPIPFPIPPVFQPRGFPYEFSTFQNTHFIENPKTSITKNNATLINQKDDVSEPSVVLAETDGKIKDIDDLIAHDLGNDMNAVGKEEQFSKFKKPKNAYEYDALMKAVRKKPGAFPKILRSKKNQFLSSLGIAPKIVCSSRTLREFRHELRYKKLMNRECMIYRERKMLRDRNKLNKRSVKTKERTYLAVGFPRKPTSTLSEPSSSAMNAEKKPENVGPNTKRIKLFTFEKKEPIETITIDSSDEERVEKKYLLSEETQEEDLKQTEKNSSVSCSQAIEEASCSVITDVKNSDGHGSSKKPTNAAIEESDNLDGREISLEENNEGKSEISKTETSQNRTTVSQMLQNKVLNNDRNSLSNKRDSFASNNAHNDVKDHLKNKHFPIPQFAVIQPTMATATDSTPYLVPHLNPTPMFVRRAATSHSQQLATFPASKENNFTRVVYPINLAKPSKIVVIDQKYKGACFAVPPSLMPQNNVLYQAVTSKSSSASTLSKISSPEQQKPKTTENCIVGSYRKLFTTGGSSKIDVNDEMTRVANWIYRMKSILNPCMLNNGSEKSVQKILAQLDYGIHLVREVKKSLQDIEKLMDDSSSSPTAAD